MRILACYPNGSKQLVCNDTSLTTTFNSDILHSKALKAASDEGYAVTGETSIEMWSREIIVYVY